MAVEARPPQFPLHHVMLWWLLKQDHHSFHYTMWCCDGCWSKTTTVSTTPCDAVMAVEARPPQFPLHHVMLWWLLKQDHHSFHYTMWCCDGCWSKTTTVSTTPCDAVMAVEARPPQFPLHHVMLWWLLKQDHHSFHYTMWCCDGCWSKTTTVSTTPCDAVEARPPQFPLHHVMLWKVPQQNSQAQIENAEIRGSPKHGIFPDRQCPTPGNWSCTHPMSCNIHSKAYERTVRWTSALRHKNWNA